jgi:Fic family protein
MTLSKIEELMIRDMPALAKAETKRMLRDENETTSGEKVATRNINEIVSVVEQNPGLNVFDLMMLASTSENAIRRNLTKAVNAGRLQTTTKGRTIFYFPTDET